MNNVNAIIFKFITRYFCKWNLAILDVCMSVVDALTLHMYLSYLRIMRDERVVSLKFYK